MLRFELKFVISQSWDSQGNRLHFLLNHAEKDQLFSTNFEMNQAGKWIECFSLSGIDDMDISIVVFECWIQSNFENFKRYCVNRHYFSRINMHRMQIFDLLTFELRWHGLNGSTFFYLCILSQEPVNKIKPKTPFGPNIIVESGQLGSIITLKCSGQASPPPVFR